MVSTVTPGERGVSASPLVGQVHGITASLGNSVINRAATCLETWQGKFIFVIKQT